jgi:hypothetical protein
LHRCFHPFNPHSGPRPPQPRAAPFKRLYRTRAEHLAQKKAVRVRRTKREPFLQRPQKGFGTPRISTVPRVKARRARGLATRHLREFQFVLSAWTKHRCRSERSAIRLFLTFETQRTDLPLSHGDSRKCGEHAHSSPSRSFVCFRASTFLGAPRCNSPELYHLDSAPR